MYELLFTLINIENLFFKRIVAKTYILFSNIKNLCCKHKFKSFNLTTVFV